MPGLELARGLLAVARADAQALGAMGDPDDFADAIFGFHAQQAVEKALKAWLAVIGVESPHSHDLGRLIHLLEVHGVDAAPLYPFIDLSDFAVRFRYELPQGGEAALDRDSIIESVEDLLSRVESAMG